MDSDKALNDIRQQGWVILPDMVSMELINELRKEIDQAYEECRFIQVKNGIEANTDGTVHHLLAFKGSFLKFLQELHCHETIEKFFNGPYILNTYGGVINLPGKASYVASIHRDIRTFYNLPMMLNMLVMIDKFSVENGATYLLSSSHLKDEKPDEEHFYQHAIRAEGSSGSILLFDSLLWHAAGINKTSDPRRALTLAFTRPFQKQQMDYPRLLGYQNGELLKQIVGFNSRVPTNLDEWYQPPHKRFYKVGQG